MADNIPQMMTGSVASGVSIADSALRYQQLKSQDAERRMREKQANLEMQYLMEAHAKQIQQEADTAKANMAFQALTTPVIKLSDGTIAPNPNLAPSTGHAFMQAFGPLAQNPKQAADIANTGAMITMHEASTAHNQALAAQVGKPTPKTPEATARDVASTEESRARTQLYQEKIISEQLGKGAGHAPPEIQKTLEFAKSLGITFDNDQIKDMVAIHAGLKTKAGTEKALPPQSVWVSQNFAKARENASTKKSDDDVVKGLEQIYQRISKPADSTPVQEEMVWVTDPSGKKGQIPKKNLDKAIKRGFKLFEG